MREQAAGATSLGHNEQPRQRCVQRAGALQIRACLHRLRAIGHMYAVIGHGVHVAVALLQAGRTAENTVEMQAEIPVDGGMLPRDADLCTLCAVYFGLVLPSGVVPQPRHRDTGAREHSARSVRCVLPANRVRCAAHAAPCGDFDHHIESNRPRLGVCRACSSNYHGPPSFAAAREDHERHTRASGHPNPPVRCVRSERNAAQQLARDTALCHGQHAAACISGYCHVQAEMGGVMGRFHDPRVHDDIAQRAGHCHTLGIARSLQLDAEPIRS